MGRKDIYFHWFDDHIEYNLGEESNRANTVYIKYTNIDTVINGDKEIRITLTNKQIKTIKHKDIELFKGYTNLMDRIENMVAT